MCRDTESFAKRLKDLDFRLLGLVPDTAQETYLEWSQATAVSLRKQLILCENLLLRNRKPISDILDSSQFGNVTLDTSVSGIVTTSITQPIDTQLGFAGAKIPKITDKDLEEMKFQGKLEDHDRFVEAANDLFGRYDVNILSWIRKFSYLKQCLPEKDKKKLLTYTQDQTGYANFWADLKISYGTKTDQIFHWKRRLEKLPRVQKLPDGKVKVASLRSHYEEAKITLRHLAKHGKDGKRCYEEFLLLLAGKLDQQSAIEWGMYFKNEKLDEGD